MKIAAALCFYDERIEFLDRCVTSLGGLVDELVAVDGAWLHQPNGAPTSDPRQAKAIREAAEEAGLSLRLVEPEDIFESQVEKRMALMELASENADWVFVIDADEYVSYSEPETIRRDLKHTNSLCAYVAFKNLNRGETMPGTTPQSGLNRRLFRAGTIVKIVHSGYFYEGLNVLIADVALDLCHCLALEHDNVNRGRERNERSRTYRSLRDTTGVETWVKV